MTFMKRLSLRLPATSANLGPCFDTAAVAIAQFLEVEAVAASAFSIDATGRNADLCAVLQDNLLIKTYQQILAQQKKQVTPLAITMWNGIPLGMGCGSSAAVLLAAVSFAAYFGDLGWNDDRILEEACRIEGHPDNVAACWLGGLTIAATGENGRVRTLRVESPGSWRAMLVLPDSPLPTVKARAVLPKQYSREDVVANLQSASLLGLAWSQGDGNLLEIAMRDRIHQPYRAAICPLLPPLLPLAGSNGILGVALSGAGPAVLLVIESERHLPAAQLAVQQVLNGSMQVQFIVSTFTGDGARRQRMVAC
jgi:homoserine kinase